MILDTFYLLFKSDSRDAVKGVDDLEKKIDSLKQKGKSRSEQENKDLKESLKSYKELNQQLKDNGNEYTKIVESIARVATSYLSISALSKGIFGAASVNSNLEIQSKLWGKNASEIKAYGAAVAAAGGSAEQFYGHYQAMFEQAAAQNIELLPPLELARKIRKELKKVGGNAAQQSNVFQKFGGGFSPAEQSLLVNATSDIEFEKAYKAAAELTKNADEGGKVAREFNKEWSNTKSSLDSVFTTIGNDLLPIFTDLNKDLQQFFKYLADNKGVAEIVFGGAAIAITTLSGAVIAALGATAAAAAPLIAIGAAVAGVGAAGTGIAAIFSLKNKIKEVGEQKQIKQRYFSKDSYRIASEPLGENDNAIMATQRALRQRADILNGQNAINTAANTNFGSAGSSNLTGVGKTINVKIGDVNVYTSAVNSQGIASDVSNELSKHFWLTLSNLDDGVIR